MSKKKSDDGFSEIFDLGSLTGNSNLKDKLYEKGIYYITGEIESNSLLEIHQDILLKHLDPEWKDDIQFIINSVGGDSAEGWALIDLLDWIKMDVQTTGLGICASLGAMLLAAGTIGKRRVGKNASVMVHGASTGFGGGNYQQLVTLTEDMKQELHRGIEFWTGHTKLSEDEVKKTFLDGADHYIVPNDAVVYGIVDFIVPGKIVKKSLKKNK